MIALLPKNMCSGCAACLAICPMAAIVMEADSEGFQYPKIDAKRCIGCGKCRLACPILNRTTAKRTPLAVYAAMANDEGLRLASSSGGIFSLLARQIFAKGGVVFGAAWDYSDYTVKICAAQNEDELAELRGSKYVQANVGNVYLRVRDTLKRGVPVLYSGTPCQIAALNHVLGKTYDNLLTVEVICHAVPSPIAFQKYAAQRMRETGKAISRIFSRDKNCSWKRYAMSLSFHDSDIAYLKPLTDDAFLRGFLRELYNRPSCHNCSLRELRSGADLTLGDYWDVHESLPMMDDDKGTSIVLVNTSKGERCFAAICGLCRIEASDYDDVRRINPAIYRSALPHPKRRQFFSKIRRSDDFDSIVFNLLRPTIVARMRHLCGQILRKFGWKGRTA